MKITKEQLAGMIDHSRLKPQSTRKELKKLCAEAVAFGFKAVCVNPVHVADAAALLKGENPLVCSVVGFPFGTHNPGSEGLRDGGGDPPGGTGGGHGPASRLPEGGSGR